MYLRTMRAISNDTSAAIAASNAKGAERVVATTFLVSLETVRDGTGSRGGGKWRAAGVEGVRSMGRECPDGVI